MASYRRKRRIGLLAAGLSTLSGLAPLLSHASELDIAAERVFLGSLRFDLVFEGNPDGYWTYAVRRDGDRLIVDEQTVWTSRNIQESTTVAVSAADLTLERLELEGDFDGRTMSAQVVRRGESIVGEIETRADPSGETQTMPVGIDNPGSAFERTSMFGLLSGARLEPGQTVSMEWFNVFTNSVESLTASVDQVTSVLVGGKRYEVVPVLLASPSQPNVVYLTTDEPRHMVRVDVVGQPMVFEYTGDRE